MQRRRTEQVRCGRDAVDVISASGYYPTGTWPGELDRIERVVREHGKPFLFIEAGCPSRAGSSVAPHDWTFGGEADPGEQAAYLDEMFQQTDARMTGRARRIAV